MCVRVAGVFPLDSFQLNANISHNCYNLDTLKKHGGEYFSNLLNVENAREQIGEVPAVEGTVQEISREEVKKAIESMKKGKAAGCSRLPIDLIKHQGRVEWT